MQPNPQSSPGDCHDEKQWLHFSGYKQLDQTKQEIRVLTLLAGEDDSDIRCTIEQGPLSEIEPFNALSYCWGPADEVDEVLVNAERVNVRKNLWQFLWQLRNLKGTIRIWVDFVCIHQLDTSERNHQVKLMQAVFSTAICVYAWLGPATPATEKAVDFIERTSRSHNKDGRPARRSVSLTKGLRRLQALFNRVYWTRLWIIQEIVLAKDVQIIVGRRTLLWKHLQVMYEVPVRRRVDHRSGRATFDGISKLKKQYAHSTSGPSLHELVLDFRHAKCQDPRDKIYGLLGIVDFSVREQVAVIYDASWLKVCLMNLDLLLPPEQTTLDTIRPIPMRFKLLVDLSVGEAQIVDELHQIAESASLRSSLPRTIVRRVSVAVDPFFGYTFAARKHSDSTFRALTKANSSQQFDIYISYAKVRNERYLLYSTILPIAGDFMMLEAPYLGSQSMSCFVARQVRKRLSIVDIGVYGAPSLLYTGEGLFDYIHQGMPDPLEWREGRIPDADIQCDLPRKLRTVNSWSHEYECTVELDLNGAAMAELLRVSLLRRMRPLLMKSMVIDCDPTCLIDADEPFVRHVADSLRIKISHEGDQSDHPEFELGRFIETIMYNSTVHFKSNVPLFWTRWLAEPEHAVSKLECLQPLMTTQEAFMEDEVTTIFRMRERSS